ncbi:hypothetical protein H4R19_006998 [Coemansia spiralis]|nr:hypothetical protein H4R19_006998 [Coemansia spiralis]
MMTRNIFARAATARRVPGLQRLGAAAAVPAARRGYTRTEVHVTGDHLNPVDMHKFLQARDREHREFLDDETEMIVTESFLFDSGVSPVSPAKPVNSEFAQQIQALLKPDYGDESC